MSSGGRTSSGEKGRLSEEARVAKSFAWLKEVPLDRLKRYIFRSGNLIGKEDPQGRSIHTVGHFAMKELYSRAGK